MKVQAMGLLREHIYTCKGRQRAVFLRPELGVAKFGLEVMEGDDGLVEICFDPVGRVRSGKGVWFPFEGGRGGAVAEATALRVNVGRVGGWVKFVVQQDEVNYGGL